MERLKRLNIVLTLILLIGIVYVNEYREDVEMKEQQVGEAYNTLQETVLYIEDELSALDVIYSLAEQYDVPPEVILAVMKVESQFNSDAQNGRCYGIMQVSSIHCNGFGIETEQLLDLHKNTEIGTSLLSGLIKDSEELYEALGKYNMGVTGYKKSGQAVTAYAKKVMAVVSGLEEHEETKTLQSTNTER